MESRNERQNYATAATRLHQARMSLAEKLKTAAFLDEAARTALLNSQLDGGMYQSDPADAPVVRNIKSTMNLLVDMEGLLRNVVDPMLENKGLLMKAWVLLVNRNALMTFGRNYTLLCHNASELTDALGLVVSKEEGLAGEMEGLTAALSAHLMPVMDMLKYIWQGIPENDQKEILGEAVPEMSVPAAAKPVFVSAEPNGLTVIQNRIEALLAESRMADPASEKSIALGQAAGAASHINGIVDDFVDFLWNWDNWNKEGMLKDKPKVSGIRKLYSCIEHVGHLVKILEEMDAPGMSAAKLDDTMRQMLVEMGPVIGKTAAVLDVMEGRLGLREAALSEQLKTVIQKYRAVCEKMEVNPVITEIPVFEGRKSEYIHAVKRLETMENAHAHLLAANVNTDTTLHELIRLKSSAMTVGGSDALYFIGKLDAVIAARTGSAQLQADISKAEQTWMRLSRDLESTDDDIQNALDNIRNLYRLQRELQADIQAAGMSLRGGNFSYHDGMIVGELQQFPVLTAGLNPLMSAAVSAGLAALQMSADNEVQIAKSTVLRMEERVKKALGDAAASLSPEDHYFSERTALYQLNRQIGEKNQALKLAESSEDVYQQQKVAKILLDLADPSREPGEHQLRVIARIQAGLTTGSADVVSAVNEELKNVTAVYDDWKERYAAWTNRSWLNYMQAAPVCPLTGILKDWQRSQKEVSPLVGEIAALEDQKFRIESALRSDFETRFAGSEKKFEEVILPPAGIAVSEDVLDDQELIRSEMLAADLTDEEIIRKLTAQQSPALSEKLTEIQDALLMSAEGYIDRMLIQKLKDERMPGEMLKIDPEDPILVRNLKSSLNTLQLLQNTLDGSLGVVGYAKLGYSAAKGEIPWALKKSFGELQFELKNLAEDAATLLPPAWVENVRSQFAKAGDICEQTLAAAGDGRLPDLSALLAGAVPEVRQIAGGSGQKPAENWLYGGLKKHISGSMREGYPLNIMKFADQVEAHYQSGSDPDAPPVQHLVDALRSISFLLNGAELYVDDEVLAANINAGIGYNEIMKVFGKVLLSLQPQLVQLAARADWAPELYGLKFSAADREKLHASLKWYDSWNAWMNPSASKYPWETLMSAALQYDASRDRTAHADVLSECEYFTEKLSEGGPNGLQLWEMSELVRLRNFASDLEYSKSSGLLSDIDQIIRKRTNLDGLESEIKEIKKSIGTLQNTLCQMEDGTYRGEENEAFVKNAEKSLQETLGRCLDQHEEVLRNIDLGIDCAWDSGVLAKAWVATKDVFASRGSLDAMLQAIEDKTSLLDRKQFLIEKAACHQKFEEFSRHQQNIALATSVVNRKMHHLHRDTDQLLSDKFSSCSAYLRDAGMVHMLDKYTENLSFDRIKSMSAEELAQVRRDLTVMEKNLHGIIPPLPSVRAKALDDLLSQALADGKVSFTRHAWVSAQTAVFQDIVRAATVLEKGHPELEKMKLQIPDEKNTTAAEYTYYLIKMLISVSSEKSATDKYNALVSQALMTVDAATARLKSLKKEITPENIEATRKEDNHEKLGAIQKAATKSDLGLFRYFRKVFHRPTLDDQIYYLVTSSLSANGLGRAAASSSPKPVLSASKQSLFQNSRNAASLDHAAHKNKSEPRSEQNKNP